MAQVQLGDDAKDFKEFINKGTSWNNNWNDKI